MKMNDGASADIKVGRVYEGRQNFVMLDIEGEGEFILPVNEACRMLEVLSGCQEEAVIKGKRPILMMHQLPPRGGYPAYLLYSMAVDYADDPLVDRMLAIILPHEAIWLKLRLEQVVASCD